jgi:hypothetical protein
LRSSPACRALAAAPLLLIAALCLVTRPARAADCFEGISEANARAVFDALRRAPPQDGCTLDEVHTEASQMTVVWKKNGVAQEDMVVLPASCVKSPSVRGKVLSAVVPPSTAEACPGAASLMSTLITGDTFGGLVPVTKPTIVPEVVGGALRTPLRVRLLQGGEVLLAACLLVAAALGLRRMRVLERIGRVARRAVAWFESGALRVSRWASRRAQQGAPRAGWGAALLLGPHIALGTWLLVVPDHLAFTASQVVTLAHVGLAVLTAPVVVVWIVWHARARRASGQASAVSRIVRWLLVVATALAAVTGVVVLREGTISPLAAAHGACSMLVGVPLALHLALAPRRRAAAAVALLLVASTAGAAAARRWLPPASAAALEPAFEYTTRPQDLYEPAENCGECHVADYQNWKRSTHARTMGLQSVHESMGRAGDLLGVNLSGIGQLLRDRERPLSAALVFGACGSCHAPTSFYGDGTPSLLEPTGLVAEGTGCSFCHTLRSVKQPGDAPPLASAEPGPARPSASPPARGARPEPGMLSRTDIFGIMSRAPFFVSAPETVRRYLGQGSRSRWAREVSNLLIRWRPQVHARDYHAPVLDDSRACLACHSLGIDSPDVPHMTYFGWEHSRFKTGDPTTTVECQDCHMVRHVTGAPVSEQARMVPWGPVRPHARSHLLLGGNVMAAHSLGDDDLAAREHAINAGAASVVVLGTERAGDVMRVTVSVRADLVGHFFPALETRLRYAWVELRAVDGAGHVVGSSAPPRDSEDYGAASPLIMASTDDPKADTQRLVRPGEAREFVGRVSVPEGVAIDKVVAELHESVDPEPLAVTTWSSPR